MATETIRNDQSSTAEVKSNEIAKPPVTLASVVADVKQDCQHEAKAYLKETEVPHGGE